MNGPLCPGLIWKRRFWNYTGNCLSRRKESYYFRQCFPPPAMGRFTQRRPANEISQWALALPGQNLPHHSGRVAGGLAGKEAVTVAELTYSVTEAAQALGVSRRTMRCRSRRAPPGMITGSSLTAGRFGGTGKLF